MPSPALVQALDRLDHALARAEQAADTRIARQDTHSAARDDAVRAAIADLDTLIASLGADVHG